VRRLVLSFIGLMLGLAPPAPAGTFQQAPIAPDLGIPAITRGVTRQLLGRDVFSSPWATVTISHIDLYDRFPYVETRNFQIVSDPQWNRLVCGQPGSGLVAFDGSGTSLGPLAGPRGLAVDDHDRVYVADTDHDRIVVLQAQTEYDDITLAPAFTITGLHAPYAVAWSDGGTPFVPDDDVLYVADTGSNRVLAYSVGDRSARLIASTGSLGSGTNAFAGPMAIAVGRSNGVNTPDVYVADAHNRRIVQLHLATSGFQWIGAVHVDDAVVTSLDTDHWGSVYASGPQQGVVRKFNASLEPVAELCDSLSRPRAFSVPFSIVTDHRDGSVHRAGQPDAVSVEQWADQSGIRLWNLGVSIDGLVVNGGDAPNAHFMLTDPSTLSLETDDAVTGRVIAQRGLGAYTPGVHDVALLPADLSGLGHSSSVTLRLAATSRYSGGPTAVALANFQANGSGEVVLPTRPMLAGCTPNPMRGSTVIAFALPLDPGGRVNLSVLDAGGRRIRTFPRVFAAGSNQVLWDGTDDDGRAVRPGLYFCRLEVGSASYSRRVAVLR